MTCLDFADVVVDLARETRIESAVRDSALAHAAACRECGGRLEEQRALSARMKALAELDGAQAAPAWIEESLRARFRRESRSPAQGHRPWAWAWATAASAILAVGSLLTAHKERPAPAPAAPAHASTAPDEAAFVDISYGDSLANLDSVQVVRVQVPSAALASLGWTVSAETDSPVEAELLVGQDGVARGIRFVQ